MDKKPPSAVYHVVQAGENLFRISVNYKTSVKEILRINSLPPGSFIKPGQKLLMSKPGAEHLSFRSQENAAM
jgi:LysM repeat protein